ncbi:hypothetical protein OIU84_013582, partial [Salix udensis]
MIARNISKKDGGETWDDEGNSTGRIPSVVCGASTSSGGYAGVNGRVISDSGAGASVDDRVISDSGAGASATALETAKSNL